MRYCSIVRRNIAVVVVICSLLWAVSGVSVVALALHEHGHHHGDNHDHHDAVEVVLHGHTHEGSPDHDHELTAPLSASRSFSAGLSHAPVSQARDLVDSEINWVGETTLQQADGRDLGPPSYLVHCVFLT